MKKSVIALCVVIVCSYTTGLFAKPPFFEINGKKTSPVPLSCGQTMLLYAQASGATAGKASYEWTFYKGNASVASFKETLDCDLSPNQPPCQLSAFSKQLPTASGAGTYSARLVVKKFSLKVSDDTSDSIEVKVAPPTASAKINGSDASPVSVCAAGPIVLNGLPNSCGTNYFVGVRLADSSGNPIGPEYNRWLNGLDYIKYGGVHAFDVKRFAEDGWIKFQTGQYYLVKFAVGNPWHEQSRLIRAGLPASSFTINGQSTDKVNVKLSSLVLLNGQSSQCALGYFVSVQRSNENWQGQGPEMMRWLTVADTALFGPIGQFDIAKFAQSHGVTFKLNDYYLVKLAVGPQWNEKTRLIHIVN